MQGRQLIERAIHLAERIEHGTEPACGVGALKRESERKRQKARAGNEDGQRDPLGEGASLAVARTKERRADKEQVDRHVGHDHQGHERDVPLPLETATC